MRIALLALLLPTTPAWGFLGPDNYHECILKEMPGAKNVPYVVAVAESCRKRFPSTRERYAEEIGRTMGVGSANECILKFAKDESLAQSASFIGQACFGLFPRAPQPAPHSGLSGEGNRKNEQVVETEAQAESASLAERAAQITLRIRASSPAMGSAFALLAHAHFSGRSAPKDLLTAACNPNGGSSKTCTSLEVWFEIARRRGHEALEADTRLKSYPNLRQLISTFGLDGCHLTQAQGLALDELLDTFPASVTGIVASKSDIDRARACLKRF